MTGPGTTVGDSGKPWGGFDPSTSGRHWATPAGVVKKYRELTGGDLMSYPILTRLDKLDDVGLIYRTKSGAPRYKSYLSDIPGVTYQDIWAYQPGTEGCIFGSDNIEIDLDVKWLMESDSERLGYPTQKPEGLLERIIKSSSKEADIVLDPFCGCGTTLVVAERLNRRWLGIDISRSACDVVRERLKHYAPIIGGETEEELAKMDPHEFARLLIVEKLDGTLSPRKSGDMGIDGWIDLMSVAVQVKRWGHKVGRPEIDKFKSAIERDRKKKGMIIAFDFSGACWNEVARIKQDDDIDIQLKTVKEILGEESSDYYRSSSMDRKKRKASKPTDLRTTHLSQGDDAT